MDAQRSAQGEQGKRGQHETPTSMIPRQIKRDDATEQPAGGPTDPPTESAVKLQHERKYCSVADLMAIAPGTLRRLEGLHRVESYVFGRLRSVCGRVAAGSVGLPPGAG